MKMDKELNNLLIEQEIQKSLNKNIKKISKTIVSLYGVIDQINKQIFACIERQEKITKEIELYEKTMEDEELTLPDHIVVSN